MRRENTNSRAVTSSQTGLDEPSCLVFSPCCSPLPHCSRCGMYDQQNEEVVMVGHFQDWVMKDTMASLEWFSLLDHTLCRHRTTMWQLRGEDHVARSWSLPTSSWVSLERGPPVRLSVQMTAVPPGLQPQERLSHNHFSASLWFPRFRVWKR